MNKAAIEQAKSRLDKALNAKNDIMLAEREGIDSNHPAWQNLYYAHPTSNNVKKQLDRLLTAYAVQFGAASDALVGAIHDAVVAAADVILHKAEYETAKADKAAAKVAAAAKRKAPPVILQDRRKNDQVVAAITEVANGFKVSVKAQFADIYRRTVAMWQEKCAERPGKTDPSTFWPYSSNDRFSYVFNQAMRTRVNLFLDTTRRPFSEYSQDPPMQQEQLRYSLKPQAEVDAIIEKRSEQEANDAIQGFIFKMTAKLGGILDAKGDFEHVQVTGDLGRNSMRFSFTDGSAFTVTNDIIINRSNLGTVFNQYPTRFTGVKLAGPWMPSGPGERGSSQSEAWMKKNFKSNKTVVLGTPDGKKLVKGTINGQPVTMSKDILNVLKVTGCDVKEGQ